ncbi:hypothetical protein C8F01DRAFT_1176307 [Mycena amicta]|nr:hypothetical protein C8F01DRAFT_1176307 [Mycena amicta]
MTTDPDKLRIAIALTALKFKPPDVSCASYVLQLRSIFPPSQPVAPTADGSWRTHALSLEKEMASLKEKYDAERIKTLSAPPPLPSSSSEPPPSSNPSTKKKSKKKGSDKRVDSEPRTRLEGIQTELACLPGSDSLFSSLSSFQQLVSALESDETTAAQRSLLLRTTQLVITAISSVVQRILMTCELTVDSQSATLQCLSNLLPQLLSSALPILMRKPTSVSSLVNKLLDSAISLIFTPILESFVPLCNRYLNHLFPLKSAELLPVDLRPDVLQLFQSALKPLISTPTAFQHNLRNTLALTALTHLEALFPPSRELDVQTHTSRVSALARKDAVWYLCTVLHLLFALPTHSGLAPTSDGLSFFERRIVDALTKIVGRCRASKSPVTATARLVSDHDDSDNEVEHGMILGVLERYWRYSGVVQ